MKKIFILSMLITPIVAYATDPVGPAAVGKGETPVIATANAPYATATEQTGDSTTVVTASYVKGVYNDTIAAVNKVTKSFEGVIDQFYNDLASYQVELFATDGTEESEEPIRLGVRTNLNDVTYTNQLVTGMAVKNAIDSVNSTISNKRVSAVTTWGNDTPTQLTLTTASN